MKGSMFIKERKDDNILTSAFIVGYLAITAEQMRRKAARRNIKLLEFIFFWG